MVMHHQRLFSTIGHVAYMVVTTLAMYHIRLSELGMCHTCVGDSCEEHDAEVVGPCPRPWGLWGGNLPEVCALTIMPESAFRK